MRDSTFSPTLRGFERFCRTVGYPLKRFQRRIAAAHFADERECVAVLPRGSEKSWLASRLAVHHVLSHEQPGVYVGAASRDQARIIGNMCRDLSQHPAVSPYVVWRTDCLRWASDPKGPAVLQIVSADGAKAHGWPRPTLILADEIWAWADREPTMLGAMLTSLLKAPQCRFLGISTAASSMDSPLGRLRIRALAQPHVERVGAVLEAGGDGLRWLEWSVPDEADAEDLRVVAAANPMRTISELREQRPRCSDLEWLQFVCCRWGVQSARWLPPGAWQACQAEYDIGPGEALTLGVDVGGSRSATAVVGVVADEDGVRVALVEVWQGSDAVLKASAYLRGLLETRTVREIVFDPMRFSSEALRLEADYGVPLIEWPQSETRMTLCSENLHRLVVEQRLRHPGVAELDRHVANAIAKPTPRGWRLTKSSEVVQVDAVISLAMAAERAEYQPPVVQLLGWIE